MTKPKTDRNGLISARQDAVAAALAAGHPRSRVARELKVGETTVKRWQKEPAFRERVDELRRELVDRAIGRLSEMMAGLALDVLTRRLEGEDAKTGKPTATLDDVKAAFELYLNTTSAADLKARVEQLEANAQQGRTR